MWKNHLNFILNILQIIGEIEEYQKLFATEEKKEVKSIEEKKKKDDFEY